MINKSTDKLLEKCLQFAKLTAWNIVVHLVLSLILKKIIYCSHVKSALLDVFLLYKNQQYPNTIMESSLFMRGEIVDFIGDL